MRKWVLILFMALVMVQIATALDICEKVVVPNVDCQLVTPTLSCTSYVYDVINLTGTIIQNGSLLNLNDSVYYLTFNQPLGGYIVRLCDNSTREVYVEYEENTMWLAIVCGLGLVAFMFGYLAFNIKKPKLRDVKLLFFVLSVFTTFLMGLLPMAISLNPGDVTSLRPVTIALFSIFALLFILFVYLYSVYWFRDVLKTGENER